MKVTDVKNDNARRYAKLVDKNKDGDLSSAELDDASRRRDPVASEKELQDRGEVGHVSDQHHIACFVRQQLARHPGRIRGLQAANRGELSQRAALFLECGLGKTSIALAWMEHVRQGRPGMICAPLAALQGGYRVLVTGLQCLDVEAQLVGLGRAQVDGAL